MNILAVHQQRQRTDLKCLELTEKLRMNLCFSNKLPPITDLCKMHELWRKTKPIFFIFCSTTYSKMHKKEITKEQSQNMNKFNNQFKSWFLS